MYYIGHEYSAVQTRFYHMWNSKAISRSSTWSVSSVLRKYLCTDLTLLLFRSTPDYFGVPLWISFLQICCYCSDVVLVSSDRFEISVWEGKLFFSNNSYINVVLERGSCWNVLVWTVCAFVILCPLTCPVWFCLFAAVLGLQNQRDLSNCVRSQVFSRTYNRSIVCKNPL